MRKLNSRYLRHHVGTYGRSGIQTQREIVVTNFLQEAGCIYLVDEQLHPKFLAKENSLSLAYTVDLQEFWSGMFCSAVFHMFPLQTECMSLHLPNEQPHSEFTESESTF